MKRKAGETDLGNRGRRFRTDQVVNPPTSDELIVMTPVPSGTGLTSEVRFTVRPRDEPTDRSAVVSKPAGKASKLIESAKRQAKRRNKA